jgi:hypothetical protein
MRFYPNRTAHFSLGDVHFAKSKMHQTSSDASLDAEKGPLFALSKKRALDSQKKC